MQACICCNLANNTMTDTNYESIPTEKMEYAPFPLLNKCLLKFPTYITHNRGFKRNLISLILAIICYFWVCATASAYYWFAGETVSVGVQYVSILVMLLGVMTQWSMLYFMATKLPKVSKLLFNVNTQPYAMINTYYDNQRSWKSMVDKYKPDLKKKCIILATFLCVQDVLFVIAQLFLNIYQRTEKIDNGNNTTNPMAYFVLGWLVFQSVGVYVYYVPLMLMCILSFVILYYCHIKIEFYINFVNHVTAKMVQISKKDENKPALSVTTTQDSDRSNLNNFNNSDDERVYGGLNIDNICCGDLIEKYKLLYQDLIMIYESLQLWMVISSAFAILVGWIVISVIELVVNDKDDNTSSGTIQTLLVTWGFTVVFEMSIAAAIFYCCALIGQSFDKLKLCINDKIDGILIISTRGDHDDKFTDTDVKSRQSLMILQRLDKLTIDSKQLYFTMFGLAVYKERIYVLVATFIVAQTLSLLWGGISL